MEEFPRLTADCLRSVMSTKAQMSLSMPVEDKPVVQLLASKRIGNGQIRCQFFDGNNSCDKCVIKNSPQIDAIYESNQLAKFSVVRLDQFWVANAGNGDIDVLVVSDVTPLVNGSRVGRKLEAIEEVKLLDLEAIVSPLDRAFLEANYENGFNPNYRPPQKNRKRKSNDSVILPIDRSKVVSIATMDPNDTSFVLRGRVTAKSEMRTFSRPDGKDGKVFNFDITDDSSEIRIVAFNSECDRFYDFIEKDMIYYINRGNIKPANRRFSNLKSDYEISLVHDSAIEISVENEVLPEVRFNYIPIDQIVGKSMNSAVDMIGVITKVDRSLHSIVSRKNQKEYHKRDVTLVDKTLHEVRLTLWNKEAEEFNAGFGQVLAVKNAMVGQFFGKTLSCVQGTVLQVDPDVTEAHILKGWFDREYASGGLKNLIPLSKARDENSFDAHKYLSEANLQTVPETDVVYYSCKATIVSINRSDKHLYKSCERVGCYKKVKEENGFYFCDKCGHNSPNFEWRLMVGVHCADATGDTWISVFNDVAEKLIGKSTLELSDIYEDDPDKYEDIIKHIMFKTFVFKLGSRIEVFNNERRVRTNCYDLQEVHPIEASNRLLNIIRKLQT